MPRDLNDDVARDTGLNPCLRKLIIPGPEEAKPAWSERALQGFGFGLSPPSGTHVLFFSFS